MSAVLLPESFRGSCSFGAECMVCNSVSPADTSLFDEYSRNWNAKVELALRNISTLRGADFEFVTGYSTVTLFARFRG